MKRIYVDMDGVLCDFYTAFRRDLKKDPNQPFPQSKYGFFADLEPIEDAIESFKKLQEDFDVWILTRPSVPNLQCYTEKAYWLKKYFGEELLYKTVLAPNKSIVKGDFLIDDQTDFGQTEFEGKLILFGSKDFPNWKAVMQYFAKIKTEELV